MFSVVAMGIKQGWAMINAQSEMVELFSRWNYEAANVQIFGILTALSALLIIFPQTFTLGNVIMAASILFIIAIQISIHEYIKALIEIPFLLLNILLIYLKYPFNFLS